MHFKVSAVLPVDAWTFLVERDSAAFRALVAKTQKLGALEIEDGWRDGDVQVLFWCTGVVSVLQHSMPQPVLQKQRLCAPDGHAVVYALPHRSNAMQCERALSGPCSMYWPLQVFKLVTKPDIDRFVPKRLQHYIPGGELTYTDIIRYDPKLLENPPFKLLVHSIPPIFKNQVSIKTWCSAWASALWSLHSIAHARHGFSSGQT